MSGALLVAGTTSDAGKSVLTAGLCRWLARQGVRVAPFKAQNMSLNSAVTVDGAEIGRAQAVQAAAAGVEPEAAMNPVLLKPGSDRTSQVVLLGKPYADVSAVSYRDHKAALLEVALECLADLRRRYDVVICEGAGSPAEINLRATDIANMGLARAADLPVLVVGDINPGGVFAALFGTVALLSPEDQALVAGFVVNKFRGDVALLSPGLDMLQQLTGRPTYGVLPWTEGLELDVEDSLGLSAPVAPVPALGRDVLRVSVVRLPRLSNWTDVDALRSEPGVLVRFATTPEELADADLVVLPGTRATVQDLAWLRRRGLADVIASRAAAGPARAGHLRRLPDARALGRRRRRVEGRRRRRAGAAAGADRLRRREGAGPPGRCVRPARRHHRVRDPPRAHLPRGRRAAVRAGRGLPRRRGARHGVARCARERRRATRPARRGRHRGRTRLDAGDAVVRGGAPGPPGRARRPGGRPPGHRCGAPPARPGRPAGAAVRPAGRTRLTLSPVERPAMRYDDVVAATFVTSDAPVPDAVRAGGPARRLRDAVEPLAMHAVWSRRVNEALGVDFLTAYVWGRAAGLGDPAPGVAAAAFAWFEPGLVGALVAAGREALPREQLLLVRDRETAASLGEVLAGEDVGPTADALLAAVRALPVMGRPLMAGLLDRPVPADPYGRLHLACDAVREARGDAHVAVVLAAGLTPVEANVTTELWHGMPLGSYTSTRGWSEPAVAAAVGSLTSRGWLADGALTPLGVDARRELEAATDRGAAAAGRCARGVAGRARRPAGRLVGPLHRRGRLPARPPQARRRLTAGGGPLAPRPGPRPHAAPPGPPHAGPPRRRPPGPLSGCAPLAAQPAGPTPTLAARDGAGGRRRGPGGSRGGPAGVGEPPRAPRGRANVAVRLV